MRDRFCAMPDGILYPSHLKCVRIHERGSIVIPIKIKTHAIHRTRALILQSLMIYTTRTKNTQCVLALIIPYENQKSVLVEDRDGQRFRLADQALIGFILPPLRRDTLNLNRIELTSRQALRQLRFLA